MTHDVAQAEARRQRAIDIARAAHRAHLDHIMGELDQRTADAKATFDAASREAERIYSVELGRKHEVTLS
jgi:hypothetical protein